MAWLTDRPKPPAKIENADLLDEVFAEPRTQPKTPVLGDHKKRISDVIERLLGNDATSRSSGQIGKRTQYTERTSPKL
jgi:hypothetical protein